MRRTSLLLICAAALAGCAGSGSYSVTASTSSPDLAYVGPDVYAVADYSEPVFYSDNYYWRYNNNVWYRSSRHNGGWVVYTAPPRAVVTIGNPRAYVHYRPGRAHYTTRDRVDRDRRRVIVRDRRR
jgi:hypothetical protein